MCGFAGFILPGRGVPWDPFAALTAMTDSLEHRGPDDSGIWTDSDANVFLGFRRLAILDLSFAGHQPMVSASGRYVVVFNGEIYNFQTLRDELRRGRVAFRSRSDTEVLLASCERWGVEGALRRFRGMFSFALFDTRERLLWLARDRLGVKPLFLLKSPEGIAFSSEARAFHHCPLYKGKGDATAAWHFLKRLYVPSPSSILAGVEKVRPGEAIRFQLSDGCPREEARVQYWDLRRVAKVVPDMDEGEAVDGLHEVLRESVRLRLVADVPVGAFLSGGVDSSVVVALMQELASGPVRTFTVTFDDEAFDEGPLARQVAEYLGTAHSSVAFPVQEVLDLVPSLAGLSDEPMANPSLLPTLLVSRVARRDVVVALSGDGGDELFGGYNRYRYGARLIRRGHRLPYALRVALASAASSVPAGLMAEWAWRMVSSPGTRTQHSAQERLLKVARVLGAEDEQGAYESLLEVGGPNPPMTPPLEVSHLHQDFLDTGLAPLESRMMLYDQMHYLPDDLLTKVDRASMWESLEARVPLLDHQLVEFSWRIPADLKIRDGVTKWPLRQIALRYLPAELIDRPKMGFTAPIAAWMSSGLRGWARDVLSPDRMRQLGIWEAQRLDDMWRRFESGQQHLALPLWTAAVLQAWCDEWKVRFG